MIVPLQRVVTIKSDHALNNCDCHLYPNPNIDVVVSKGCILKKDYEPPLQQFHFQLRWKPQIRGYKYINMYIYTQLISAKTLINFHSSPYIYQIQSGIGWFYPCQSVVMRWVTWTIVGRMIFLSSILDECILFPADVPWLDSLEARNHTTLSRGHKDLFASGLSNWHVSHPVPPVTAQVVPFYRHNVPILSSTWNREIHPCRQNWNIIHAFWQFRGAFLPSPACSSVVSHRQWTGRTDRYTKIG